MDREFPGSYPLSDEDLDSLWQDATITFDANVLLNIYHYGAETRDQLLASMQEVACRDQLWIPYQALVEFHHKRMKVIKDQDGLIRKISEVFGQADSFMASLKEKDPHHPYFDLEALGTVARETKQNAGKLINQAKGKRIDPLRDPLLTRLTEIIGNRFGTQPTTDQLMERQAEWLSRASQHVPPGFADADKPDGGIGDYLIWRELLEEGKVRGRPVVFVTDDSKDDWWERHDSDKIGHKKEIAPRSELVNEMHQFAGVRFHLTKPDGFLRFAQEKLGLPENEEVLEEAQEVSRQADKPPTSFREQYINRKSSHTLAAAALYDWMQAYQEPSLDTFAAMRRLFEESEQTRSAFAKLLIPSGEYTEPFIRFVRLLSESKSDPLIGSAPLAAVELSEDLETRYSALGSSFNEVGGNPQMNAEAGAVPTEEATDSSKDEGNNDEE
jgi:PIN like domain